MANRKLEFEIKVDTSEMTKALKELGVAIENVQKATIYCTSIEPKKAWYKRFWKWLINKKPLNI